VRLDEDGMHGETIIRSATAHELDQLGALKLRASLAWGDLVAELQALPEARQVPSEHLPYVFVAEHHGTILGFATVLPSDGEHAELEDLFVDPPAWRRGVGAALTKAAEVRVIELGRRVLRVVANNRALPFYEALGFQTVGVVETLFEPAPQMMKVLR
jgi:GNAT superfamily N-acetyltransferase